MSESQIWTCPRCGGENIAASWDWPGTRDEYKVTYGCRTCKYRWLEHLSAAAFQQWQEGLPRQAGLVRTRPWFKEAERRREERLREGLVAGSILCVKCGKAVKPGERYSRVFYENIEVDGDHYSHVSVGRMGANLIRGRQ